MRHLNPRLFAFLSFNSYRPSRIFYYFLVMRLSNRTSNNVSKFGSGVAIVRGGQRKFMVASQPEWLSRDNKGFAPAVMARPAPVNKTVDWQDHCFPAHQWASADKEIPKQDFARPQYSFIYFRLSSLWSTIAFNLHARYSSVPSCQKGLTESRRTWILLDRQRASRQSLVGDIHRSQSILRRVLSYRLPALTYQSPV